MAVDRNLANQCVEALNQFAINITESVNGLDSDHVLTVYDQDILLDATRDLHFPCIGVIYEGMSRRSDNRGLGVDLTCSFIVITGSKEREIVGKEDKESITLLMDRLRNQVLDSKSPTGHKWEFDAEFPMDIVEGALSYYQRWKTKAILT